MGRWSTVYVTETVTLSEFKLLLNAQSNQKKTQTCLGNYIPVDAESLQFSPKMKSTLVIEPDNQASSKKHNP